jgi:hypothetical protein
MVNFIQTPCKNGPTLLKQDPHEPVGPELCWQHPGHDKEFSDEYERTASYGCRYRAHCGRQIGIGQSGTQQGQAGQAGGGAQAQISTEQRTQIRQTVMQGGDAPRVSSVNFSLSVDTVVPRTVKYVPLPPRAVEIYPAWRGYHFFIVGDQIVIVESGSLRIVAVIPA